MYKPIHEQRSENATQPQAERRRVYNTGSDESMNPPPVNHGHSTLWQTIVAEAQQHQQQEPLLAAFYAKNILNHHSLPAALSAHLAAQLGSPALPPPLLETLFQETMAADTTLIEHACADIHAYRTRDPACHALFMPLLYFKGFQALQSYRLAHWLWQQGDHAMARFLQHRVSLVWDIDIHPAARLGHGIMIDHATAVVIGETVVIGHNVSLLHAVTLMGAEDRSGHLTVADYVLIGAGAKLCGHFQVGEGAKIAAGSLVLQDVQAHTTVAGVPAKMVGRPRTERPALDMRQQVD